ncbi:MAG TPA: VOC family protein [Longimicrobiales bacterium]|nr:VOC family protein [Longimicrobiales bacterium]
MTPKVGYATPMLHVDSIERSIAFYELLGFTTIDTDRARPLGWARLHCEGGALMFLRAETPPDPAAQSILLYMYTDDLAGLREHLLGSGFEPPPIHYPEYMPSGELFLRDPDGYGVGIAHWGETEHEAWLRRIGRAPSGSAP